MQEKTNIKRIAIKTGAGIYMTALTIFISFYITKIFEKERLGYEMWEHERTAITAFISIAFIVVLGYFMVVEKNFLKLLFVYHFVLVGTAICTLLPIEFMPFMLIPMVVTAVYDTRSGIVCGIAVSVTLMIGMGEYPLYILSGTFFVISMMSCFAVWKNKKLYVNIVGVVAYIVTELVILIYFKRYCMESGMEYEKTSFIVKMMVTAIISVLVSNGIRMLSDMFFSKTTPDVVLKKIVSEKAPAITMMKNKSSSLYYHSMEVAEISRLAAKRIGANYQLAYAGGFYHDLGKLVGNEYIKEGLKLADKYDIPKAVKTIMVEHNVKSRLPKSKEAAIVMLSDTAISTIEYVKGNMDKKDVSEGSVVENALNKRLISGTLKKSGLTIEEFEIIKETLVGVKEKQ